MCFNVIFKKCAFFIVTFFACLYLSAAEAEPKEEGGPGPTGTEHDGISKITENVGFLHGFVASLSVILVSEIGDKTFFIAAIMAMRHPRLTVFGGAISALILMTILSAVFGWLVNVIPRKYTFYISTALFAIFGLKMLKEGCSMSPNEGQEEMEEVQIELRNREEQLERGSNQGDVETGATNRRPKPSNPLAVLLRIFLQAFTLTFLAEWGDRSQLTTIILGARENVYGVILGGIIGHSLCTGVAVLGGRMIAQKISVRTELGPQPLWNSTYTDFLRRDLLLNYDKFARPAQHFNVTTVKLGLRIRHIELNEFKSTITVHSWFKMVWEDQKLKWDPEKYGGIRALNLADHEIWQPDIFLYNSAASTTVNHFNTHCVVYPNGDVLWVPPAQFSAFCDIHLKYWPFDSQMCFLRFGSWTYHGGQVDINPFDNDTSITEDLISLNAEWLITKTTITKNVTYYSCCPESFPDVTVTIWIKRVSPSYKAIIVTPAIVIIFLTLLSFWLPPNAGEKIVINGCTAIIICLFLLYFTQKMPAMGSETPMIVLFYSSCLYIVTFSMIGSVLVVTLSRTKHTKVLPWFVKQKLTGKLGIYLGLGSFIHQTTLYNHRVTAEEMRDHQVTDFDDLHSGDDHGIVKSHHPDKTSLQEDWILLAAAIDKISFIFYCLLFIVLAIVYSI